MKRPRLKLRFTIDKQFRKDFDRLAENMQKKIVRRAIRAAVQPIETSLKAEVLANAQSTGNKKNEDGSVGAIRPQSTGATFRAVKSKVSRNKYNSYRYYGVVGIDKAHLEYINSNARPETAGNGRYQQIYTGRIRGLGKHGTVSYYKSKRAQPREVKAMARRKFGSMVESIRNPNRRKRPSKYWHILLRGASGVDKRGPWAGRRKHNWAGNDLLMRVVERHRESTLAIFANRIEEGLKRGAK